LPPKGYANLSIREDVRRMLDELRAETGIHDLSDLLVVRVRTYRDYTNAISKIQELLTSTASKTLRLLLVALVRLPPARAMPPLVVAIP
jgi:hypothetical protein